MLLLLLLSCRPAASPADTSAADPPPTYGLSAEPYTTLQALWAPLVPGTATVEAIASGALSLWDTEAIAETPDLGVERVEGVEWIEYAELAPDFVEGTERRSIVWLWQAADPQLIDEESPVRLEALDYLYRPGGHVTTQVFEAHVRSARRISDLAGRPFDFAIFAGDLTDGSQQNELDWFLTALNGGAIDPDSGDDDDPVPGPGNDPADPFWSDGLDVPWYATIGNHETHYNGGVGEVTDEVRDASVGGEVFDGPIGFNGYRDGATEWGDLVTEGSTPADARRLVLRTEEVLTVLQQAEGEPAGHGMTAEDAAAGVGWYSVHPVPDRPVRLVVLDTVTHDGPIPILSAGSMTAEQGAWLEAELAAADAAHELVIVMSHHRADDFTSYSEYSADQLTRALAASEGVVLHVTGHGHRNRIDLWRPLATDQGGAGDGYWELMLASTVDFPMHSRMIELVDEGNGYLSIYATNLGHNSEPGSLAHLGRQLQAASLAFPKLGSDEPDIAHTWEVDVPNQDLLLRVPLPASVAEELARHDFPTRIESVETLAALPDP
ncbi:MAG: metallophosphoesterase [Alphaproteobacteria bacterium]|nr:metallophosphoesterase [Alphaproteobacteria bacterium]